MTLWYRPEKCPEPADPDGSSSPKVGPPKRGMLTCCQNGAVLIVVILTTYFSAAKGILVYRYTDLDGDVGDDSFVRMDDVSIWALALSVGLAGWAALWAVASCSNRTFA